MPSSLSRYLNSVRRYKVAASAAPPIHVFLYQKMTFIGKTHFFLAVTIRRVLAGAADWPVDTARGLPSHRRAPFHICGPACAQHGSDMCATLEAWPGAGSLHSQSKLIELQVVFSKKMRGSFAKRSKDHKIKKKFEIVKRCAGSLRFQRCIALMGSVIFSWVIGR